MRVTIPMNEKTRAKMRLIPSARKERLKKPPFCENKLILTTSPFITGTVKKRRKTKERETTTAAQKPLILLGNKRQKNEPIKGTKILRIR